LPIVLTSGYAELPPQITFEFLRLGKPYSQDDLAEALKAALNTKVTDGSTSTS
jgi:hypothetical protein